MPLVRFLVLAACSFNTAAALSARRMTEAVEGTAESALHREWSAYHAAEAEGARFWTFEWQAMESSLLRLQAVIADPHDAVSLDTGKAQKFNLEPKSAADLAPTLAMLKTFYEEGKARIGKLNAHEQELKRAYSEKEAQHKKKLDAIAALLKNGTLSKEMVSSETRDADRVWKYWSQMRSIQHHQFHTSLKLQHSTLSKVKQMIDLYTRTISGKEDKKKLAKEFASKMAPEVVLMQETRKVCAEGLAVVRGELAKGRHEQE